MYTHQGSRTTQLFRPPPHSSRQTRETAFSLEAVVLEDKHVGALEVSVYDPLDVEELQAARDVVEHGRLLLGRDVEGNAHVGLVQQVKQACWCPFLYDAQVWPDRARSQSPDHEIILKMKKRRKKKEMRKRTRDGRIRRHNGYGGSSVEQRRILGTAVPACGHSSPHPTRLPNIDIMSHSKKQGRRRE